jgi:hypothetical protein
MDQMQAVLAPVPTINPSDAPASNVNQYEGTNQNLCAFVTRRRPSRGAHEVCGTRFATTNQNKTRKRKSMEGKRYFMMFTEKSYIIRFNLASKLRTVGE